MMKLHTNRIWTGCIDLYYYFLSYEIISFKINVLPYNAKQLNSDTKKENDSIRLESRQSLKRRWHRDRSDHALYSASGSRKTQLCYTICAMSPSQYNAIYIDTEGTFCLQRIECIAKARRLHSNIIFIYFYFDAIIN